METIHAVTSLTHTDADPGLLAGWLRAHWRIENSLHWVRDVTLGEDHSTIRTSHGPANMATLRNTGLNVMRLHGSTNIAATQREFSYRPDTILDVIAAA